MPAKAYSLEDGNLSNKPIITSQTRTYNDIDLSFKKKKNQINIYCKRKQNHNLS